MPLSDSPLLLALDASTTSLRAFVFDDKGRTEAEGRAALTVETPAPRGYEQDAESWWTAARLAIHQVMEELPPERHGDLVALSIAHHRETVVVTDEACAPLARALLWMDGRAERDVENAKRRLGAVRLHALSGKPACTTPSIYKLMYLFRTRPELLATAHVHDVHSFLSQRLTGRAVSSFASADPTGLVDMRQKRWSDSLLGLVGVEPHQLPELVEPGYLIGPLTRAAARELGLPEHVLVYAGAGDAQAAGLGAGIIGKGRAFLDLGTAVTCGTLTDTYQIDQAFRTLHSALAGRYCLETTLRGGMQTLWWFAESILGASRRTAVLELEAAAAHVRPGSDGLVALPYWAGVMNPYWDDQVGGGFLGLHARHEPVHLYRALLEGIALEVRFHLEGVEASLGRPTQEVVAIGGGSRSALWCQIFADVLGRPFLRAETADAAALGVAVLAAVSHGIYPSFEHATSEMTRLGSRFEPSEDHALYERLYRDVYRGLYHDIGARMRALGALRELESTPLPGDVE